MSHPHLLINLPPGFCRTPSLTSRFDRLSERFEVVRTSHDTAEQILPDLEIADAVLMWSWPVLDDALLDLAPALQFAAHLDISQRGARAALARRLPVSVGRAAFSPAVAEMALTLALTALRQVSTFHAQMRAGTEPWVASFPDEIDGRERQLSGRRVGIIGFGRIGRRFHELLAPFHCQVGVYDPYVPESGVTGAGATLMSLDELVATSEVLVLCAASNEGTRHVLGADQIAAIPKDAVLVNVARAALVDTDALVARLRQDDLTAVVDVFDTEPLPADHPLRLLPNALLTPHRAGGVMESVYRILDWLTDDLIAHFDGRPRSWALTESMVAALDA